MNCAPGAGVEPAIGRVKAGSPTADGALPEWSRLPVPTRVSCLTGAGSQPCATARHRRGTGASDGGRFRFTEHRFSVLTPVLSVPGAIRTHTASASCWCLLPLSYEDVEPPPGADPGHPPYEGEAAAVRGGVSCPARIRTSIA